MHPIKTRLLLASIGAAALSLAGVASVQSSAQPAPPVTPPIQLAKWIQSIPNRAMSPCPMSKAAETPEAKFFAFVTVPKTCLVDGPYRWGDQDWHVQRMWVGTPPHEVIRVCSAGAIHSDLKHVDGPCGTTKGAGPLGCEICRVSGVAQ